MALGAVAARADQPDALRGHAEGGKVEMPKLHAPTEVEGPLPNPDPMARKLGVAVVGLGHLSLDQILPGIASSKHVRLAALVSGERDKALVVAGQYGLPASAVYDYAGFERLANNPDVHFVYIVLPNDMHAEYTVRAARMGKHVLCEKPMATSVAEAEQMIAACREAGRLLMIAYRLQYDPYHRLAIRLARSGQLGQLRAITAVNGQNDAANGQWRQVLKQAGGGSLPDVGLYCLNAARYLTGEEPIAIAAQLTRPADDPRFREVEDLCAFTLRFPSGVVANCMSGYSLHESRQLRVMGSDAFVTMDPAFGYGGLRLAIGRKAGDAASADARTFVDKNQFAREMDHFAECIASGRTPHTPGEEGLQDQRLIAAIYEAARSGGTVQLPAVAGLDTHAGAGAIRRGLSGAAHRRERPGGVSRNDA